MPDAPRFLVVQGGCIVPAHGPLTIQKFSPGEMLHLEERPTGCVQRRTPVHLEASVGTVDELVAAYRVALERAVALVTTVNPDDAQLLVAAGVPSGPLPPEVRVPTGLPGSQ